MGLAGGTGEEPIVADTVESALQDVEQEAPDKLVCAKRHELLSVGAAAAIILVVARRLR